MTVELHLNFGPDRRRRPRGNALGAGDINAPWVDWPYGRGQGRAKGWGTLRSEGWGRGRSKGVGDERGRWIVYAR